MGYSVHTESRSSRRARSVSRILWAVLTLNLAVAVAKLVYGAVTGAVSMLADGFHSLFDGAANVVGIVGVDVARKPADESHPYGHGKYETWASVGIGVLLAGAAWSVGRAAIVRLLEGGDGPEVGVGSFVVMGVTIVVNLFVSVYERGAGRRLDSEVLMADASHTGSDVLVSSGVVAGLIVVEMGYPQADPLIALFVAGMIMRAAWSVFRRAESTFSDRARIPVDEICDVVLDLPGVLGCHDVRTRGSLADVYVDLHVQVDPSRTIREAHQVAEDVERSVCERFERVADVIVHVEPMDDYQAEKTAGQSRDRE